MSAGEAFVAFAAIFFGMRAGIAMMKEKAWSMVLNAAIAAWGIATMGKG